MKLTPEILKATYSFLICTPPIVYWKLPTSESIEFKVAHTGEWYGWCEKNKSPQFKYLIKLSDKMIGHTQKLLSVMCHELIHVKQYEKGISETHGYQFKKDWALIAKHHGFDPKDF